MSYNMHKEAGKIYAILSRNMAQTLKDKGFEVFIAKCHLRDNLTRI